MKNKKLAVVALMLIAVLTLSVGYAALTDVLTIKGDAEITAAGAQVGFDEKVYFSAATVKEGKTDGANYLDSVSFTDKSDSVSFIANSLNSSDDKVVFEFVVTNDSDHDATITLATKLSDGSERDNPYSSSDKFTVTYLYNGAVMPSEGVAVAKKGGTMTVTVTVTPANGEAIPTEGTLKASFVCEMTATAAN